MHENLCILICASFWLLNLSIYADQCCCCLLFFLFYSRDQIIKNDVLFFSFLLVTGVIKLLSLSKQTWSQRSKTHCLYIQDIKSTKCQITGIIEKQWNTFKILILEVMIGKYHSTKFILSFHLGISMLCAIGVRHAYNVMFIFGPCVENISVFKNRTIFFV